MYHPAAATPAEIAAGYSADDFEFLEIYNRSGTAQTLRDYLHRRWDRIHLRLVRRRWVGSRVLDPRAGRHGHLDDRQPAKRHVRGVRPLRPLRCREPKAESRRRGPVPHHIRAAGIRWSPSTRTTRCSTYTDPDGWVSLGTYLFNGTGTVVLTRGNAGPNDWTIADQVKFQKADHEVVVDNPALASPWSSSGPTTLAADAYLVLVSNYAAFDSRYDVVANAIPVAGVYSGSLSNNGDAVKLFQVGDADPQSGYVPYYRVDYVNFQDHAPWPEEPDGTGSPLNRLDVNQYGNDPINWIAGGWHGTPGEPNVAIDKSAPSAPTDLTGHVTVDPDTITLSWTAAVDNESYVDHYVVYRDGSVLGTSTTTSFPDVAVVPLTPYVVRSVRRQSRWIRRNAVGGGGGDRTGYRRLRDPRRVADRIVLHRGAHAGHRHGTSTTTYSSAGRLAASTSRATD